MKLVPKKGECIQDMLLLELTDVGSAGMVFPVQRPGQEKRAIKVLRPDRLGDEVMVRGFAMEAYALSEMTRADRKLRVPAFYSNGFTSSGLPFIEMELIRGSTLFQHFDPGKPLKKNSAVKALFGVCEALTDLHATGFIHGDVSAPNVMIEGIGGTSRVVLVDFGAARRIDDRTQQESATGELGYMYMSPEQANGYSVGARTDVFYLGGLLCRILYGRGLYPQRTHKEQLAAAREGRIDIPQRHAKSKTEGRLRNLIRRATQPAASDRLESPEAFADRLRFALNRRRIVF